MQNVCALPLNQYDVWINWEHTSNGIICYEALLSFLHGNMLVEEDTNLVFLGKL